MKPRDLALEALAFDAPKRVLRELPLLPWATNHHPEEVKRIQERFPSDFGWSPIQYVNPVRTTGDPYRIATFTDEWGCTFENI